MEIDDPVLAAGQVVEENFPGCRVAILSDGVLTARRTPTSDLDIVVVLDGPPAPYRETMRSHGWVVELFVHSRESLVEFYQLDARNRRCSLARMCCGHVILDRSGEAADIQTEAHSIIDAGPKPLTSAELEQRRYFLSDLLDDLRGAIDPTETIFIASHLLEMAGTLLLMSEQRWTGTGKWLSRQLEEAGSGFAARFGDAFRTLSTESDKAPLVSIVESILESVGGPLTEGFSVGRHAPT